MSFIVDCPHCQKQWFITEDDLPALNQCPFCENVLNEQNCDPRRMAESRLDTRSEASGCQVYLRASSLFDWLKKPDIHVYDIFDLSEGGAGIFLSEHSVIDPKSKGGTQKVIIEGLFLDMPVENKRIITGPIQIPAEVRWVTGASGDGRAGLRFLDREEQEGRDTIAEILKILRDQSKGVASTKASPPETDPGSGD